MPFKLLSLPGKPEQKKSSLKFPVILQSLKPYLGITSNLSGEEPLFGIYCATYFYRQNQSHKKQEERILEPSRVSKGIHFKILIFITLDKIIYLSPLLEN